MTKNKHTAFTQLPVVDISALCLDDPVQSLEVARALDKAAREAGFLYLRGHGVPAPLIEQLKAVSRRYFSQDVAVKMRDYIGRSSNHTGYVPQGEERFYSGAGEAQLSNDLKEGYDIGPETPSLMQRFVSDASTVWPQDDEFKRVVGSYYQAMLALSRTVFRGFAMALGIPEDNFTNHLTTPPSQLRLLHYFDYPDATESDCGIGAHTDYEFFTILLPTSPGLQVMNGAGCWIDVPVMEDGFVLNIGDMMELMTNGEYVATSHRVQQVREERYAFPFFSSLDYDTLVQPMPQFVGDENPSAYRPLICGDHLLAQTVQTFQYLKQRLARGEISLPEKTLPLASFGQAGSKSS
ncbi:MAG: 2OG-Fe(II) oxygenase family protein [Pseudomonadota bacterium]